MPSREPGLLLHRDMRCVRCGRFKVGTIELLWPGVVDPIQVSLYERMSENIFAQIQALPITCRTCRLPVETTKDPLPTEPERIAITL